MANIKSNITINSNIYIRNDSHIKDDVNFIQNIKGVSALKKIKNIISSSDSNIQLTDSQIQELEKSMTCEFALNGEITHGKVIRNGETVWVCRCEYKQCSKYSTCAEDIVARPKEINSKITNTNNTDVDSFINDNDTEIFSDDFETIELFDNTDKMFFEDEEEIITSSDNEIPFDTEFLEIENNEDNHQINTQDFTDTEDDIFSEFINNEINNNIFIEKSNNEIITDFNMNNRYLINSGSGTGKTYTVINRIIYILKNNIIDAENILILCNFKNTVKKIEQQINNLLYIDSLNLYTFDEFLEKYFSDNEDYINTLNYDEVNQLFNKDVLIKFIKNYKYIIIDEFHELRDENAKMILNILNNTNCGFLILGDTCQALESENIKSKITAEHFFGILNDMLDKNVFRCKFTQSRRQNNELAEITNSIRNIILDKKNINEIDNYFKNIPYYNRYFEVLKESNKNKTAILCRTNGVAEKVSSNLYKNKISHKIIRKNNTNKLNRWISDVFWDYQDTSISRDNFIKRYCIRVSNDYDKALKIFNILEEITESINDYIEIDLLLELLQNGVKNNELLTNSDNIIISSIYDSREQEFEQVFIPYNDLTTNTIEDAKLKYIAISKAKDKLAFINASDEAFHKLPTSRIFEVHTCPDKKQAYLKSIVIGYDNDIDIYSFISNELFIDVYENQRYISEEINKNDELEIIKSNTSDNYYVCHNQKLIGLLSEDMINELRKLTKIINNDELPSKFKNVYVKDIITVIGKNINNDVPFSNIWLGIEISGLAEAIP